MKSIGARGKYSKVTRRPEICPKWPTVNTHHPSEPSVSRFGTSLNTRNLRYPRSENNHPWQVPRDAHHQTSSGPRAARPLLQAIGA